MEENYENQVAQAPSPGGCVTIILAFIAIALPIAVVGWLIFKYMPLMSFE